ncbi:MAG TPA: exodeoxyribonuclease V subunit gamma, partial [Candidatus Binataceae bacterium]|nr:exodeoxyribonuclease V subunit gamma [Candidatus Binataceae bacterium]
LRFPFLRGYLAELVARASDEILVLEASDLALVLYECLRGDEFAAAPEFREARGYVGGGVGAEVRRYELAERLAHLFQEYSLSREAMLGAWRKGGAALVQTAFDATESWQRRLWQLVFEADGAVRSRWLADGGVRRMLLPDAIRAVPDARLSRALPPELHVFAVESPAQIFAGMFARLGALTQVAVYALNPCAEFWEDLDSGARARGTSWASRAARLTAGEIEAGDDPYALKADGGADPLALRMWGRPGREYIRLLNDLTQCDFVSGFDEPGGATLLAELQRDVLLRREHHHGAPPAQSCECPASIRVLGCAGVRREVEAIASELVQLVRESAGAPRPLRFHEIGVMVPDSSAELYRTHFETVFRDRFDLPIENGAGSDPSRVIEAIRLLFELPLGRLPREEVLRVLRHPAVAGAERETASFAQWCEQAGVMFGADADDFTGTYLEGDRDFHWDQALSRLALGAFLDGGDLRLARTFAVGAGRELLPLHLREDDREGAAWLLRTARSLLFDAREIRPRSLRLREWSREFAALVERYIVAAGASERRARDRALDAIAALGESPVSGEPMPYAVAHRITAAVIAERASRGVAYAGHGVAIGPLSALHSLPWRVTFIAGLGESIFPERENRDPLDLRNARRRAGDVSPAERDRYQFLEALLAAREKVVLSYVRRDSQTGDPLEPSTVIRELQFVLRKYLDAGAVEEIECEQPVSRYDTAYLRPAPAPEPVPDQLNSRDRAHQLPLFKSAGNSTGAVTRATFPCYDSNALRGARFAALREHLESSVGPLPSRDELRALLGSSYGVARQSLELIVLPDSARRRDRSGELLVPLSALRRFLECPLQGAARFALGMREEEEPGDEIADEPIAQSRLDRTRLLREVFWEAPRERFEETYARAYALAKMAGRAPAGEFGEAERRADQLLYAQWREQAARAGCGNTGDFSEVALGHAENPAQGTLRTVSYVDLDVRLRAAGPELLPQRVRIFGRAGHFAPDLATGMHCVLRNKPKPHDFHAMILGAIALAAAGECMPTEFRAQLLGSEGENKRPPWTRLLKTPTQAEARAYLSGLVADLLSNENHYFLPIEAIAEIFVRGDKWDPVELADGIRERPLEASCRSDFGPVRNARLFDPPDETQIRAIVRSRYEILAPIFEKPR